MIKKITAYQLILQNIFSLMQPYHYCSLPKFLLFHLIILLYYHDGVLSSHFESYLYEKQYLPY